MLARGLRLLREPGGGRPERRPGKSADEAHILAREPIRCRRCRQDVADPHDLFPMRPGEPGGVFVNPHGFVHEVVTVFTARNLLVEGQPTGEFTWFPGYAWAIASCGRCAGHVGWRFTASGNVEPAVFWGLRRTAVTGGGI